MQTVLYHITHIENLPAILGAGGLWCDRQRIAKGLTPVGIAHQHIKDRRAHRRVPCCRGGTLADYVPLYFAPRSPMLYAIHTGFVTGYQGGQQDVVHLVTSAERIEKSGLPFAFTDGHAEIHISEFFTELQELSHVDMQIMTARIWKDTQDDGDRKRRRQAEFLVYDFLPWSLFGAIGVANARMEARVNGTLASASHKPSVVVRRDWYY